MLLTVLALGAEARSPKPCWVPSRLLYTGRETLAYVPIEEARRREADLARLEHREPRELNAGWLSLEVNRTTLAAADPALQLLVVSRDGAELLRVEPESQIPDANPEVLGFWYAYAVVQLPEGLAPPFDVDVTDRLMAVKCSWSVDADGSAVLRARSRGDEGDVAAADPRGDG